MQHIDIISATSNLSAIKRSYFSGQISDKEALAELRNLDTALYTSYDRMCQDDVDYVSSMIQELIVSIDLGEADVMEDEDFDYDESYTVEAWSHINYEDI